MTGSAPGPASVLDNLTTAVAVLTIDGRVLSMNAAAESLFGVSCKQALDRHLTQLHPDLELLDALVKRAAGDGQSYGQSYGQEFSMRPAYSQEPSIRITCRATPVRSDGVDAVILELLDATHWRQIDREQGLISQQDASRRAMYQLAHEIRNPLGGLRGAAQLLERELTSVELREYTRIIITEADRLAALTDTLLSPVRMPKHAAANIHEIVDRVIALLSIEAAKGIVFVRDYDPSLPPVLVDRDQALQAFLNIGRNALQAIGGRGRITFRTRAQSNCVIGSVHHRVVANIEIEDDGPGIAPELGDSIFLPLVSGRPDGTGLGLPLAQEVVSRHGGLIEFRSRPGQTVFAVRLPLELSKNVDEPRDT